LRLRHQLFDLRPAVASVVTRTRTKKAPSPAPKAVAAKAVPRVAAKAHVASPKPNGGVSVTVDRLHQVALTATNLDQSVAFYRDTLGLRFIARFDPPGLAFFSLGGGTRLLLSATASAATLYFSVDDMKSAYADFQKRGVHFLQPPAMVHRDDAGQFGKKGNQEWMAFFHDPAGNTLALVEKRA
jgi:catechol 2,3-dioxygenase-like lactoylglutathione lyase family enzyme